MLALIGRALVSVVLASSMPVSYRAPVAEVVVLRPFDPNLGPYQAGHRAVDLAAAQGQPVLAAGPGVVRFAGMVAGHGVVVLVHPDGISTEYEPVTASVRAGTTVVAGQVLGTVSGAHRGCPVSCLHWGAKRQDVYLDPMGLLLALGPVRLLPWPS